MIQDDKTLIHTWGELGKRFLGLSGEQPELLRMDCLKGINLAILKLREISCKDIESILHKSNAHLAIINLSEPFLLDFSSNKWFAGGREEGYSNWLAWLLQQLEPAELLKLLEIIIPNPVTETPRIFREYFVEKGHVGQTGRIDILIHFKENDFLINIEVKVTNAENADLIKNIGYDDSLRNRFSNVSPGNIYNRLLIIQSEKNKYDGYEIITWESISLGLRRIAIYKQGNQLVRSLCLCFAGAIEQNLLGYSKYQNINPDLIPYLKVITESIGVKMPENTELSKAEEDLMVEGFKYYPLTLVALNKFRQKVHSISNELLLDKRDDLSAALKFELHNRSISLYLNPDAIPSNYNGRFAWVAVRIPKVECLDCYFGVTFDQDKETRELICYAVAMMMTKDKTLFTQLFDRTKEKSNKFINNYGKEISVREVINPTNPDELNDKLGKCIDTWIEFWNSVGGIKAFFGETELS